MRVVIMQGFPGSGKSYWARNHVSLDGLHSGETTIVSADHFFENPETGEYRFDPTKLGQAHAECMRNFLVALDTEGVEVIVVDNTNITVDQMSPYYLVARSFNAKVDVVRVICDPEVAAARNSHGVPRETVLRMARSMQDPPKFWEASFHKIAAY